MTTSGPRHTLDELSGAAYGVAVFAGVLLAIVGSCQILMGLSAVLEEDAFTGIAEVYEVSFAAWGWANMLLGAIGLVVGVGILRGHGWAASAGIGYAVLSILGQFAFLTYHPFATIIVIAIDIVVIWALAKLIGPR